MRVAEYLLTSLSAMTSESRAYYLEMVEEVGRTLANVPEEFRDREMCLVAVKSDGYALKYVPEEFRDREMYLIAVEENGYVLEYVPSNFRDHEMCLVAVKSHGCALKFIPRWFRTKEVESHGCNCDYDKWPCSYYDAVASEAYACDED